MGTCGVVPFASRSELAGRRYGRQRGDQGSERATVAQVLYGDLPHVLDRVDRRHVSNVEDSDRRKLGPLRPALADVLDIPQGGVKSGSRP